MPESLEPAAPEGARRGPILLRFLVHPGTLGTTPPRLEWLRSPDDWGTATVLWSERRGQELWVAWNSRADVPTDVRVVLRLVTQAGSAPPLTVDVRNAPEVDRIILVGHKLVGSHGTGTPTGTKVHALRWSTTTQRMTTPPVLFTVGEGPDRFRAAPHGRATAVLESTAGTVSIIGTPLDAELDHVRVLASLKPPYGSATGIRWSADGRYLYVLGLGDGTNPPALWRYEPTEDLSEIPDPVSLATLPGPPSRFDVDGPTGQILVACGSGGHGKGSLVLLGPDGRTVFRLEENLDPANDLAIQPSGGIALWTGGISGDQVRRFRFDGPALVEEGAVIHSVRSPQDVVFHPSGHSALISNLDRNTVTSIVVGPAASAPVQPVGRIPLAADMDVIESGSRAGTVFVTAVTAIYRVLLSETGVVQNQGVAFEFGKGAENVATGIAVQR